MIAFLAAYWPWILLTTALGLASWALWRDNINHPGSTR